MQITDDQRDDILEALRYGLMTIEAALETGNYLGSNIHELTSRARHIRDVRTKLAVPDVRDRARAYVERMAADGAGVLSPEELDDLRAAIDRDRRPAVPQGEPVPWPEVAQELSEADQMDAAHERR